MASLKLVIEESRDVDEVEPLITLIYNSLKKDNTLTFSRVPKKSMQIEITGKKADLKKLKAALEEKGETASIGD